MKILPQSFADLIKPDPALVRERPDPIVYRCKKCRRVLASQANIIPHLPRDLRIQLAKKGKITLGHIAKHFCTNYFLLDSVLFAKYPFTIW